MTSRFTRTHGAHLHVAQEAKRAGQARADDQAYAAGAVVNTDAVGTLECRATVSTVQLPRFVPISNLDFKTGIAPPSESSKYRNIKTDGYASKKEARRAWDLKLLERAGTIANLRFQVRYILIPAQYEDGRCVEHACIYIADFVYDEGGKTVVEDAKGLPTRDYIVKRKLMLFVHKIRVRET